MLPHTAIHESDFRRRPGWMTWAAFSPLVIWLGFFIIAPNAIMLVYSFCERDEIGQVQFKFTLENYRLIARLTDAKVVWTAVGLGTLAGAAGLGICLLLRHFRGWFYEWKRHRWIILGLLLWLTGCWLFLNIRIGQQVGQGQLLNVIVDSINYAAAATGICVVVGYPAAFFIGRAPEKWRNILIMLVMIPFWTSFLIRTYAWKTILADQGIFNSLLMWAGLISEPFRLTDTVTAVMIGLVYTYLPFMILPIYGSVEKLDNSVVEAAFDLGANPFKAFWKVILPLTSPGVIAGILLVFIPAIGMFAINDILGGKNVPMIGNEIEKQFIKARNMPYGAALAMVLMIVFVVVYAITNRRQGR